MTGTLIHQLQDIVGRRYVHTGARGTRRFRRGYRYGDGEVLAAVEPGTLVEQWRVLEACIAADVAIIFQAANTGLTGGSTPFGDGYDRPIVIVSTLRNTRIDLLDHGRQVLCMPGATLDQLEKRLKPLGREPHSVIGSSCIGASVTGGICNNSGGSLVQRGPAYTELSMFAQVDAEGRLHLVNHLGVRLGSNPLEMLNRLDKGDYTPADVDFPQGVQASDIEYKDHVRDIHASTPARFNADPRRHYEASGSAGKIGVFAVRLDTFAVAGEEKVFYIGSRDPAELEAIRRHILAHFQNLPIAGEYMHSDAFRAAQIWGKDLYMFIRIFGTLNVPRAFAAKNWFDGLTERFGLGKTISDHLLQFASRLLPEHLPKRLVDYRDSYPHHLMIRAGDACIAETRNYLASIFPSATGSFIECNEIEGKAAFLNRFTVGSAVVRYRAVHRRTVEDIVALDVALPRDTLDWFETLPRAISDKMMLKIYVGHFLCHVMHQEYLVKKGVDCAALEHELCALLDARNAEYPAEHNVGHLYEAKPALREFYRTLDPTNTFNPGIGKTSKCRHWHEPP
ncbi:D-lactate dehydrogenase [Rhizobium rosettiformans]|uniref:D-lactate dehydrogenase n=1 Tax=Rhizobium rosettiformans TaxID=1368430 RepID=UPI002863AC5B|nr:D-lactate dehydrogenase [Rhizobium rosettiformans]MDR7030941.1 D-lactate dehydrogenase [Rhizobium rosettiformans]MDR7066840.1 D-lactate dehydrogenase [Rhizobium rosettiformans]